MGNEIGDGAKVGKKLGRGPGRPPSKLPKISLLNLKYECCRLGHKFEQWFILY